MIGRNEPVSKKAKFWQSYVRSLKGTEDIRADDYARTRRSVFPELTTSWPYTKSIYDDPKHAADRITVPGYRYMPIHRETYGYSPRPIYAHNYPSSLDRYRPIFHVSPLRRSVDPYDAHNAWQNHLNRLAEIDRLYPSRYGLYLKDRASPVPSSSYSDKGLEYEPDNKPHYFGGKPIYTRGGLKKPWQAVLNTSPFMPITAITRDPFWWDYPGLGLQPYVPHNSWTKSPFFLRDSYLSPVKRTYLWDKHPIRPLAHVH